MADAPAVGKTRRAANALVFENLDAAIQHA
jgi:hypothetical protein